MADYYGLIKRAVDRLDPNSPRESRRVLYERARVAQLTQLRSISPALTKGEITREQLALEEAVRRVEAEAVQRAADAHFPTPDDLIAAADDIGKARARPADDCSTVPQPRAMANPFFPDQTSNEALPSMMATGDATGRLIRYWRWRSFSPRHFA